eukprot:8691452-Prorocentrum_lima.AAC.1
MLEDSEVPALLGLRTVEGNHGVIDTRVGEQNMYMCENPKDIIISIREGAQNGHIIQLEKAPSGHLLTPCTAYAQLPHHKKQVTFE